MDAEPEAGEIWEHHSGHFYRVLCLAAAEATGERLIVYQSQTDGRRWVRPLAEWAARFEKII
jgi:hypothetical protein